MARLNRTPCMEEDNRVVSRGCDGDDGGFYGAEGMSGVEQVAGVKGANENGYGYNVQAARTSELTISFEGEVYVFPAVTPQKVQAVLLLLGEADANSTGPSSDFLLQQNAWNGADISQGSKLSRRIASLERFREKRKERCFEKKIRYTCRKEIAERMNRKNGQFASLKDSYNTDGVNSESSNSTPHSESCLHRCQHCGIDEKATPAMRRGPAGPRTLCNACGLMWANKGTLRELRRGERHVSFDNSEAGTVDVKPSNPEPENSANLDEEGSVEENKPVPLDSQDSLRPHEQDLLENDQTTGHPTTVHLENPSSKMDDEDFEDTLDELGNVSSSEFEIPGNFDDQVMVF